MGALSYFSNLLKSQQIGTGSHAEDWRQRGSVFEPGLWITTPPTPPRGLRPLSFLWGPSSPSFPFLPHSHLWKVVSDEIRFVLTGSAPRHAGGRFPLCLLLVCRACSTSESCERCSPGHGLPDPPTSVPSLQGPPILSWQRVQDRESSVWTTRPLRPLLLVHRGPWWRRGHSGNTGGTMP